MTHWSDILESDEGGCVEKEGEIGHEVRVVRERERDQEDMGGEGVNRG